MEKPIADQIVHEMKQIDREMDAQKNVIKNSLGNAPVLEAAESELKALHTRLAVLKGNLRKLQTAQ
jgi:hypothetical protein